MSYIRWSSKIPGQKNTSRIYAWADIEGGIRICGRDINNTQEGEVVVSYPEMYYMCINFLNDFRYETKKGKVPKLKVIKRNHRGFWKKWDREYEKKRKATLSSLISSLRAQKGKK